MIAAAPIDIKLIAPSASGRGVVKGRVEVLVQSLKALGLRTPITVRAATHIRGGRPHPGYELVAGRHRYEAAKVLGWEEIEAYVMDGAPEDAELWEIDENFARAELSDSQRADHHARRERILIGKGLVKPGAGRPPNSAESAELPSYADHAAEGLGVSRRTVAQDLARGKKIAPDVLAEVAGSDLDKGVVLDELAATPRAEQSAKLIEIAQRRSAVRPAPDPLNDPEAHEKQLAALMSAWNRAAGPVRQEFLLRIDTPVFDRGAA